MANMRNLRVVSLAVVGAWGLALSSCGRGQAESNSPEPTPPPAPFGVVSEHRFAPAPPGEPRRPLGTPCGAHGEAQCESGLCLHAGGRGWGYFCSRTCTTSQDCALPGWRCAQTLPSPEPRLCVPSREWVSSHRTP